MKKFLAICFVTAAVLLPTAVSALGTLDPLRLQMIQQKCSVLQTGLEQLQRRDLVARTNRGREYENTAKQLDALSQRLHHNNIDTIQLDGPAASFKATLDAFREAYVQYDNAMIALRQIDCRAQPEDFANQLERTSIMRQEVGAEVARGDVYLAAYRVAVLQLQTQLPVGSGQ